MRKRFGIMAVLSHRPYLFTVAYWFGAFACVVEIKVKRGRGHELLYLVFSYMISDEGYVPGVFVATFDNCFFSMNTRFAVHRRGKTVDSFPYVELRVLVPVGRVIDFAILHIFSKMGLVTGHDSLGMIFRVSLDVVALANDPIVHLLGPTCVVRHVTGPH